MFKLLKRLVILGTILSLLTLNVLTVTSAFVFDALSGAFSSVAENFGRPELMANSPSNRESAQLKAVQAENKVLKKKSLARQAKVKNVGNRIARRTTRNATMHIASAAGEAVPYVGAAVVVGALAVEVYDSCETLKDMEEMLSAFELETDTTAQERTTVCAQEVPSMDEITTTVKNGWQRAYSDSVAGIQNAASATGAAIKGTTDIAIDSVSTKAQSMREAIGTGVGRFIEGSKASFGKASVVIGEKTYQTVEATKKIYGNTVNGVSVFMESVLD